MPSANAKIIDKTENFRTRVAAERRERMRARLLDAVLDLYQPGQGGVQPSIDDVIRAAKVSRGSFYKYFESVEHAARILGEHFLAQSGADFQALFGREKDPAIKAIGGAAMAISRAWHDPRWGGFTVHVDYVEYFTRASATNLMVRDCLEEARRQGQMSFDSLDAAFDLILGATVQARRRMIGGVKAPSAYANEMLEHVFLGLGMKPRVLSRAKRLVWERIAEGALGWWSEGNGWNDPS